MCKPCGQAHGPQSLRGFGLSGLQILKLQEEFSRAPGGMRMHWRYAMDLNWRPLCGFGTEALKKELMPGFQDRSLSTCWAVTDFLCSKIALDIFHSPA